ncbi:hypothetical protein [Olleya sp. HaHaR_3_96]|uniref:hypothetical protein n=1 Tax=Olleya sp. HaHaR_3_96 TaxID=2745560 RepID=UPI001C5001B3|nr:hypothetical protein [Olleya sp. HaHaR_3_96]QXP60400.1 hypothetical protein H0I26_01780 [Olleya sp. HaHaR_3_96]
MRKIILFFVVITCCNATASAQTDLFAHVESSNSKLNRLLISPIYDGGNPLTLEDIEGSPYLTPAFEVGSVNMIKQKVLIRYNSFNDLFEIKQNTDNVLNLNKSNTNYIITINNYSFKSFLYPQKNSDQYSYFALLTTLDSTKVGLLKTMRKNLNKVQEASSSYVKAKRANFSPITIDKYYILTTKQDIIEFKPKSRSLYSLFPELKTEIKSYIKTNDIDLKKEEDLIKTIAHINSLN